jgi:predicted Zn-dependent protease
VHPRDGIITGMTRDGTFRIRDGKIAEPLVNLRFTVAVPDLLRDVLGLEESGARELAELLRRAVPVRSHGAAIATERFTVTGVGSKPGI